MMINLEMIYWEGFLKDVNDNIRLQTFIILMIMIDLLQFFYFVEIKISHDN